jgi:hypothetical protein
MNPNNIKSLVQVLYPIWQHQRRNGFKPTVFLITNQEATQEFKLCVLDYLKDVKLNWDCHPAEMIQDAVTFTLEGLIQVHLITLDTPDIEIYALDYHNQHMMPVGWILRMDTINPDQKPVYREKI